jgi:hypothetical protein
MKAPAIACRGTSRAPGPRRRRDRAVTRGAVPGYRLLFAAARNSLSPEKRSKVDAWIEIVPADGISAADWTNGDFGTSPLLDRARARHCLTVHNHMGCGSEEQ